MLPAELPAGCGSFVCAKGSAVRIVAVGLVGRTVADDRPDPDAVVDSERENFPGQGARRRRKTREDALPKAAVAHDAIGVVVDLVAHGHAHRERELGEAVDADAVVDPEVPS